MKKSVDNGFYRDGYNYKIMSIKLTRSMKPSALNVVVNQFGSASWMHEQSSDVPIMVVWRE